MPTILVVEDDPPLLEGLVYNLTGQDYVVESASEGPSAVEIARRIQPDLIILDVMLPGMDGFEVCRILRYELSCPILMLTARAEVIDRVIGLEIGADDYILKPFSMRELIARVKAHLRHDRLFLDKQAQISEEVPGFAIQTFDDLILDHTCKSVTLNGKPLDLTPKQYELLYFMTLHQYKVLSRESILEQVWGWQHYSDTHTVDVHIHWLRKLIEVDPQKPVRIITVFGYGYRFEG